MFVIVKRKNCDPLKIPTTKLFFAIQHYWSYISNSGAVINGQVLVGILDILKSNDTRATHMDGELGKLTTPSSALNNAVSDP